MYSYHVRQVFGQISGSGAGRVARARFYATSWPMVPVEPAEVSRYEGKSEISG